MSPLTVEHFAQDSLIFTVKETGPVLAEDAQQFLNKRFTDFPGMELYTSNVELLEDIPIIDGEGKIRRSYSMDWPTGRSQAEVISLLYDLYQAHQAEVLAELPDEEANFRFISDAGGMLELVSISLNWMYSAAQGHFVGGGPGSDPMPVQHDEEPDCSSGFPSTFDLSTIVNHLPASRGSVVQQPTAVFILDTAWPKQDLEESLNHFPKNRCLQELVQALMNNDPYPHLHYRNMTNITIPSQMHADGWAVEEHTYVQEADPQQPTYYSVQDHGLFIAGTIYQLAPCADIHLVETLNEWGVGSLRGLLDALLYIRPYIAKIQAKEPEIPLAVVINVSIVISFATTDELLRQLLNMEDPNLTLADLVQFIEWMLEPAATDLQFAGLDKSNTVVLAAAGNDNDDLDISKDDVSNPADPRVVTRYPADHPGVVGVGALDSSGNKAVYSNAADDPDNDGIWMFGGDVDPGMSQRQEEGLPPAAQGTGMVGLYIAKNYPIDNPENITNENGWAYWSGTSFATGLASSVFAKLVCENGYTLQELQEALIGGEFPVPRNIP